VASLLSRLAPLVITLRGSKRQFRSVERTLAAVERAREHPRPFEPKPHDGVVFERGDFAGWPVFEVRPRDARLGRRAVYLHGGVYAFEIDPAHWRFLARLAVESGATFVVPIMPLSPVGTASTVVPVVADLVEAWGRPRSWATHRVGEWRSRSRCCCATGGDPRSTRPCSSRHGSTSAARIRD
jgi:acetyl esterase/lipase